MSEAVALYNVEGDVAIISMNRPEKRNALSTELKEKLIEFFQKADSDDKIAVVVLRGNGKSFCAGADISPNPAKKQYKGDALKTHAHHSKTLNFHIECYLNFLKKISDENKKKLKKCNTVIPEDFKNANTL